MGAPLRAAPHATSDITRITPDQIPTAPLNLTFPQLALILLKV
ncbi:MAG: hypothetical protein ACI87E_004544 [Mariniblastus sp.]|jgi:hypothetical protein